MRAILREYVSGPCPLTPTVAAAEPWQSCAKVRRTFSDLKSGVFCTAVRSLRQRLQGQGLGDFLQVVFQFAERVGAVGFQHQ